MNNKKNFVIDSDVLLSSPFSLNSFDEHNVILVDVTLENLNDAKDGSSEKGRNAREVIRFLENIRQSGNITKGVDLKSGGKLRVVCNYDNMPVPISWDRRDPQVRILQACKSIDEDVTLVTNNAVLRMKADILGIRTEPYKTEQMADLEHQYTGRGELTVSTDALSYLYESGYVEVSHCFDMDGHMPEFNENQYFVLRDEANRNHTGLARYRNGRLIKLREPQNWGVKPRNVGQRFALDALAAPADEIACVILKGSAGTGKTLLSCAAAINGVLESKEYDRCITTRPNFPMDRDIGFLKGSEKQKVLPLLAGIADNLLLLTKTAGGKNKDGVYLPSNYAQKLYDDQIFVAQALGFLRGRSLVRNILILDEAQNTSPHQSFSVVSRIGEGSKLILCGDIEQIDNPALDSRTNGLTYAAEKMRGSPLVAQVTFEHSECVRSPLALEALQRMSPKGSLL